MLLILVLLCIVITLWYAQDVVRVWLTPRLGPGSEVVDGPLISVIIPARNESARIGVCLAGLARQTYRRFEVIVIDDGSTDGTDLAAAQFADRLPHLSIQRGSVLPEGWAGKSWACWQGAQAAQGEWLLFLDADVLPHPALLGALVGRVQAAPLDLLTLVPLVRLESLAERIILPAFFSLILTIYPLQRVNRPQSALAFAIGQCIFFRREAYLDIDGHRAVRACVLEDMELAAEACRAGYRLFAAEAPDLIEVRMYPDWRALQEGLQKHAPAGLRHGGRRAGWVGVRQLLSVMIPWQLLGMGLSGVTLPAEGISGALLLLCGGVLALTALASWGCIMHQRYRISSVWGALMPVGMLLYFALTVGALIRVWSGRGLAWKGRVFLR
jgi:cellulose synthase/poly-beta-1,6-N-acetylglucosamine synthase-like glycosyltransferase